MSQEQEKRGPNRPNNHHRSLQPPTILTKPPQPKPQSEMTSFLWKRKTSQTQSDDFSSKYSRDNQSELDLSQDIFQIRRICSYDEQYLDMISQRVASASLAVISAAQELRQFADSVLQKSDLEEGEKNFGLISGNQEVIAPFLNILTILESMVLGDFPIEVFLQRPHILQSLLRVLNEFFVFPPHVLSLLEPHFKEQGMSVSPSSISLPTFAPPRAALEFLHQLTRQLVARRNYAKTTQRSDNVTLVEAENSPSLHDQDLINRQFKMPSHEQMSTSSASQALLERISENRKALSITSDVVIDAIATADSSGFLRGPDSNLLTSAIISGPLSAQNRWTPLSSLKSDYNVDSDVDFLASIHDSEVQELFRKFYISPSLTVDAISEGPKMVLRSSFRQSSGYQASQQHSCEPVGRLAKSLFAVLTSLIIRSPSLTSHLVPLLSDIVPLLFPANAEADFTYTLSTTHINSIGAIAKQALSALDETLQHALPLGSGTALLSSFTPSRVDLISHQLSESVVRSATPVPIVTVAMDIAQSVKEAFQRISTILRAKDSEGVLSSFFASEYYSQWLTESLSQTPRLLAAISSLLIGETLSRIQPWLHLRLLNLAGDGASILKVTENYNVSHSAKVVALLLKHRKDCYHTSRTLIAPLHLTRTARLFLDSKSLQDMCHKKDLPTLMSRIGCIRWVLFIVHVLHAYFPLSLFPKSLNPAYQLSSNSHLFDAAHHPLPAEFVSQIVSSAISSIGTLPLISIHDWLRIRDELSMEYRRSSVNETSLPIMFATVNAFDSPFELYHDLILTLLRHPSPRIRTEVLTSLVGRARAFNRAQYIPSISKTTGEAEGTIGGIFSMTLTAAISESERCSRDAVDSATSASRAYTSSSSRSYRHAYLPIPDTVHSDISGQSDFSQSTKLNVFQRNFHLTSPAACLPFVSVLHDAASEFVRGANTIPGSKNVLDGISGVLALLACTTSASVQCLLQIIIDAGIDEDPDLDDAERGLGSSGAKEQSLTYRRWVRIGVAQKRELGESVSLSRQWEKDEIGIDCDIDSLARAQRLETGQLSGGLLARRAHRDAALELLSLLQECLPQIMKPSLRTNYRAIHLAGLNHAETFSLAKSAWESMTQDGSIVALDYDSQTKSSRQPRFPEPLSAIERSQAPIQELLGKEHSFVLRVSCFVQQDNLNAKQMIDFDFSSKKTENGHLQTIKLAKQRSVHEYLQTRERSRMLAALAALEPRYGRNLTLLTSASYHIIDISDTASLVETQARALDALRKLELTWQGILHPRSTVRARASQDLWRSEGWYAIRRTIRATITMSRAELASALSQGTEVQPRSMDALSDLLGSLDQANNALSPVHTASTDVPLLVVLAGAQLGKSLLNTFRGASTPILNDPEQSSSSVLWTQRLDSSRIAMQPARSDPLLCTGEREQFSKAPEVRINKDREVQLNQDLVDQEIACNRETRVNPPLAVKLSASSNSSRLRALWESESIPYDKTASIAVSSSAQFAYGEIFRDAMSALRVLVHERPSSISSNTNLPGNRKSLAVYLASCSRLAELSINHPNIVIPLFFDEGCDPDPIDDGHGLPNLKSDKDTTRVALFVLVDLLRSPLLALPSICEVAEAEIARAAGLNGNYEEVSKKASSAGFSSDVSLLPSEATLLAELAISTLQIWFCLITWLTHEGKRTRHIIWEKFRGSMQNEPEIGYSFCSSQASSWDKIVVQSEHENMKEVTLCKSSFSLGSSPTCLSPLLRLFLIEPLSPFLFHPYHQVRALAASCATLILFVASSPLPIQPHDKVEEDIEQTCAANSVDSEYALLSFSRSLSRQDITTSNWVLRLPTCLHSSIYSPLPTAFEQCVLPVLPLKGHFFPFVSEVSNFFRHKICRLPPDALLAALTHMFALESASSDTIGDDKSKFKALVLSSRTAASMTLPSLPTVPSVVSENTQWPYPMAHSTWNPRKAINGLSGARSALSLLLALADLRLSARFARDQRAWLTLRTLSSAYTPFDPLQELLPGTKLVQCALNDFQKEKFDNRRKKVAGGDSHLHQLLSNLTGDIDSVFNNQAESAGAIASRGEKKPFALLFDTENNLFQVQKSEREKQKTYEQTDEPPVAPIRCFYVHVLGCSMRTLAAVPYQIVNEPEDGIANTDLNAVELASTARMLTAFLPQIAFTSESDLIANRLSHASILLRILRTAPSNFDDELVLSNVISSLPLTLPLVPNSISIASTAITPLVSNIMCFDSSNENGTKSSGGIYDLWMRQQTLLSVNKGQKCGLPSTVDLFDDAHLLQWSSIHFKSLLGLILRLLPCESWDSKKFPSASSRGTNSSLGPESEFSVPSIPISNLCVKLVRCMDGRGRTVVRALASMSSALNCLSVLVTEPYAKPSCKAGLTGENSKDIPSKLLQKASAARIVRLGVTDEIIEGPLVALLLSLVNATSSSALHLLGSVSKSDEKDKIVVHFEDFQIVLSVGALAIACLRTIMSVESIVSRLSYKCIAATVDSVITFIESLLGSLQEQPKAALEVSTTHGITFSVKGNCTVLSQQYSACLSAALDVIALCCSKPQLTYDSDSTFSNSDGLSTSNVNAHRDNASSEVGSVREHIVGELKKRRQFSSMLSLAIIRSRLVTQREEIAGLGEFKTSLLGILLHHRDTRVRVSALTLVSCLLSHSNMTHSSSLMSHWHLLMQISPDTVLRIFALASAGVTQVLSRSLGNVKLCRALEMCTALRVSSQNKADSIGEGSQFAVCSMTADELLWIGRIFTMIPQVSPVMNQETASNIQGHIDLSRILKVNSTDSNSINGVLKSPQQLLQLTIELVSTFIQCGSALSMGVSSLRPILAQLASNVLTLHPLQSQSLTHSKCFSEILLGIPNVTALLKPALESAAAVAAAIGEARIRKFSTSWLETGDAHVNFTQRQKAIMLKYLSMHSSHFPEYSSDPFFEEYSSIDFEQCEAAIGCLLALLHQSRLEASSIMEVATAKFLHSRENPIALVKLFIVLSCSLKIRAQAIVPRYEGLKGDIEESDEFKEACEFIEKMSKPNEVSSTNEETTADHAPFLPPISPLRFRVIELLLELFTLFARTRPVAFLDIIHTAINELCAPVSATIVQTYPKICGGAGDGVFEMEGNELEGVASIILPEVHPFFGLANQGAFSAGNVPRMLAVTTFVSALSKWIYAPYSIMMSRSLSIADELSRLKEHDFSRLWKLPPLSTERMARSASFASTIIYCITAPLQPLRRDESVGLMQAMLWGSKPCIKEVNCNNGIVKHDSNSSTESCKHLRSERSFLTNRKDLEAVNGMVETYLFDPTCSKPRYHPAASLMWSLFAVDRDMALFSSINRLERESSKISTLNLFDFRLAQASLLQHFSSAKAAFCVSLPSISTERLENSTSMDGNGARLRHANGFSSKVDSPQKIAAHTSDHMDLFASFNFEFAVGFLPLTVSSAQVSTYSIIDDVTPVNETSPVVLSILSHESRIRKRLWSLPHTTFMSQATMKTCLDMLTKLLRSSFNQHLSEVKSATKSPAQLLKAAILPAIPLQVASPMGFWWGLIADSGKMMDLQLTATLRESVLRASIMTDLNNEREIISKPKLRWGIEMPIHTIQLRPKLSTSQSEALAEDQQDDSASQVFIASAVSFLYDKFLHNSNTTTYGPDKQLVRKSLSKQLVASEAICSSSQTSMTFTSSIESALMIAISAVGSSPPSLFHALTQKCGTVSPANVLAEAGTFLLPENENIKAKGRVRNEDTSSTTLMAALRSLTVWIARAREPHALIMPRLEHSRELEVSSNVTSSRSKEDKENQRKTVQQRESQSIVHMGTTLGPAAPQAASFVASATKKLSTPHGQHENRRNTNSGSVLNEVLQSALSKYSNRIEPILGVLLSTFVTALDPLPQRISSNSEHFPGQCDSFHFESQSDEHDYNSKRTSEDISACSALDMEICDSSPAVALLVEDICNARADKGVFSEDRLIEDTFTPVKASIAISADQVINLHSPSTFLTSSVATKVNQVIPHQISIFEFAVRRLRGLTSIVTSALNPSQGSSEITKSDRHLLMLVFYANLILSLLTRPEVCATLHSSFIGTVSPPTSTSSQASSSLMGWLTQKLASLLQRLTRILRNRNESETNDFWMRRTTVGAISLVRILEASLRSEAGLSAFSSAVFPRDDSLLTAIKEFHAIPRNMRMHSLSDSLASLSSIITSNGDYSSERNESRMSFSQIQSFIIAAYAQNVSTRIPLSLPPLSWNPTLHSSSKFATSSLEKPAIKDESETSTQGQQRSRFNSTGSMLPIWSSIGQGTIELNSWHAIGKSAATGTALHLNRSSPLIHWGSPVPLTFWLSSVFVDPTKAARQLGPVQASSPSGEVLSQETKSFGGDDNIVEDNPDEFLDELRAEVDLYDRLSLLLTPDTLIFKAPLEGSALSCYNIRDLLQHWIEIRLPTIAANSATRIQDPIYRIGVDCALVMQHLLSARGGNTSDATHAAKTLRHEIMQGHPNSTVGLASLLTNPTAIPHVLSSVVSAISIASESLRWLRFADIWVARLMRPEAFIVGNHSKRMRSNGQSTHLPEKVETKDQMNPRFIELTAEESTPPATMMYFGPSSVVSATASSSFVTAPFSKGFPENGIELARALMTLMYDNDSYYTLQKRNAAMLSAPIGAGYAAVHGIESLIGRSARAINMLRTTRITVPGARFAKKLWSLVKPIQNRGSESVVKGPIGWSDSSTNFGETKETKFLRSESVKANEQTTFDSSTAATHTALGPFAAPLVRPSLTDALLLPLWFSIAMPLFRMISTTGSLNSQAGQSIPSKSKPSLSAQLALHIAPLEALLALAPIPSPSRPLRVTSVVNDLINAPGVQGSEARTAAFIPTLATSEVFCEVVSSLCDLSLSFGCHASAVATWALVPDVVRLSRSSALSNTASSMTALISGNSGSDISASRVIRTISSETAKSDGSFVKRTGASHSDQPSNALLFELTPATLLSAVREVLRLYVAEQAILSLKLLESVKRSSYQLVRRAELDGVLDSATASECIILMQSLQTEKSTSRCGICAFSGLLRLYFAIGSVHILRDQEHHLHASGRESLLAMRNLTPITCPACNTRYVLESLDRILSILTPSP